MAGLGELGDPRLALTTRDVQGNEVNAGRFLCFLRFDPIRAFHCQERARPQIEPQRAFAASLGPRPPSQHGQAQHPRIESLGAGQICDFHGDVVNVRGRIGCYFTLVDKAYLVFALVAWGLVLAALFMPGTSGLLGTILLSAGMALAWRLTPPASTFWVLFRCRTRSSTRWPHECRPRPSIHARRLGLYCAPDDSPNVELAERITDMTKRTARALALVLSATPLLIVGCGDSENKGGTGDQVADWVVRSNMTAEAAQAARRWMSACPIPLRPRSTPPR